MGEPKADPDGENKSDDAPGGAQKTPEGEQVSLGDRRIEVDFLAFETCRRVAHAIAEECAAAAGGKPLFVGPVGVSRLMFQGRALASSLDALRTELLKSAEAAEHAAAAEQEAVGQERSAGGGALESERRGVRERADAAAASLVASLTGLTGVLDAASAVLDSASKIAGALGVFETHVARDVAVGDDLAATLVAAALRRVGVQPRLLSSFSSLGAATRLPILDDLATATARLRAAVGSRADEAATPLLAKVDELVSGTETSQGATMSLTLLAMVDGSDGFLLAVKAASAGGAYRVRRSLLTWLGLADPVSASGGTALAWALTQLGSGEMIAGDLTFEIGEPVRWARAASLRRIGNLPASLPERQRLAAPQPALAAPAPQQAGAST